MMHGLQEALAAHPLQSMVHVRAFFEAVGLIKELLDDAEDGGGAPRITNFIYPPEREATPPERQGSAESPALRATIVDQDGAPFLSVDSIEP
jgi:hypothetical protein